MPNQNYLLLAMRRRSRDSVVWRIVIQMISHLGVTLKQIIINK